MKYRVLPQLNVTAGIKVAEYNIDLKQFPDNGKTVGGLGDALFTFHSAEYRS